MTTTRRPAAQARARAGTAIRTHGDVPPSCPSLHVRHLAIRVAVAVLSTGILARASAVEGGASALEREHRQLCRDTREAIARAVAEAPAIPLAAEGRVAFNEAVGQPGGACGRDAEVAAALRGDGRDASARIGELSLAGDPPGATHRAAALVNDAGGPQGSGRYWAVDLGVELGGATVIACFTCYTYALRPLMSVENPPRWQLFRAGTLSVPTAVLRGLLGGDAPLFLVYRLERAGPGAARLVIDPEGTARAIRELGEAYARQGDRVRAEAYRAAAARRRCRPAAIHQP